MSEKRQSFAEWLAGALRQADLPVVADYVDAGTAKRKRDASARARGRSRKRPRKEAVR